MEARLLSLRSSSLYSSALKGVSVSLRQFLPQRSRFRRASASDSGAEVMAFKDGLGSEFKDLPPPARAPYLHPPDGLSIPHFLAHVGVVCTLYGHFLRSLCHTHRSNLPIGAIKR